MLAKCVNPVCSNQFRFLHQGKLLEVEIQFLDKAAANDHRDIAKGKVHIERYWLCDQCSEHVTLRFDKRQGLLMYSFVTSEEVLIPLSSSRTVAEISQVRIRPLGLNVGGERDLTGGSEVRRQAA